MSARERTDVHAALLGCAHLTRSSTGNAGNVGHAPRDTVLADVDPYAHPLRAFEVMITTPDAVTLPEALRSRSTRVASLPRRSRIRMRLRVHSGQIFGRPWRRARRHPLAMPRQSPTGTRNRRTGPLCGEWACALRATSQGAKTPVYYCRLNGKLKMLTLGPLSKKLGLSEARKRATNAWASSVATLLGSASAAWRPGEAARRQDKALDLTARLRIVVGHHIERNRSDRSGPGLQFPSDHQTPSVARYPRVRRSPEGQRKVE